MSWILSGRRRWLVLASAGCAAIATAILMPVHPPEIPVSIVPPVVEGLSTDFAAQTNREVFGALLASRRWGDYRPRPSNPETPTAPEPRLAPGINPELLKMNFVGLITVQDQHIVLLKLPEVGIVRYVAGDTLPDGRLLVSVTDNSLRLKATDVPEEELLLFPRGTNEARQPGEPPPRDHNPAASR
ncbi:MAG: hypothetical protein OYH76_21915 [Defluviicoccus sp.]|nr:hypothetical protein [Defluviicoccus sp.]MDE0278563.1 hypothetical protein [Defluviicoccus sp.]